jgi:membrane associated rhomboid family serine protease
MMPETVIPMLGASGAVAGILGCYFVLFPHAKVKTLLIIFFFITITEVSAGLMLGYWFVLQLISAIGSIPGLGSQGGVAFFAHAIGFVIGILFGIIYRRHEEILEPYYD